MADKKVTALTESTSATADDLLLVINSPNTTPSSNKISVKNLFGSITSNTVFSANVQIGSATTASTSNLVIPLKTITSADASTFVNSDNSTGLPVGSMFFGTQNSVDYIYVVTSSVSIKRVALSSFTLTT